MLNPNPLMMLRIAQGDAYCAATEYIKFPRDKRVYEEALKFKKYLRHPTHLTLRPGTYTDDTQMSIAVAEVLLNGNHVNTQDYANAFVECFKRDEREGYARGFQKFLESVSSGEEFLEKIRPDSDKNGAAMRSVPIGILEDIDDVWDVAEVQAKVTHNTLGGMLSSIAVALMAHYAMYVEDPLEEKYIMPWLKSIIPEFTDQYKGNPGRVKGLGVGLKTANAVLYLITSQKNLLGILKETIINGGDTDSVAAIAMGIASARMDGKELPSFLEDNLENGKYGRDYLKKLGQQLMEIT